jgi:hypothetical protein
MVISLLFLFNQGWRKSAYQLSFANVGVTAGMVSIVLTMDMIKSAVNVDWLMMPSYKRMVEKMMVRVPWFLTPSRLILLCHIQSRATVARR